MNKFVSYIHQMYEGADLGASAVATLTALTVVVVCILMMALVYVLLSKYLEPLIDKITRRTAIKWDDIVFRHAAMRWVWLLFPLIIGNLMLPPSLTPYPMAKSVATVMINLSLILVLMMIVIEGVKSIFLLIADHDKIDEIAEQMRIAKDNGEEFVYQPSHSLKGLQQMITIIIIGVAVILCISLLFGKNPLIIVSGLGAAAAILMLVFQDSILGVVAGIQLTANDMLQPGDWISVPKFEANGIVREVTLAAVKVQNWDKTIVTIPPYKLLTEGFQNWKGMQKAKGRRVARSINIDISSIRYATEKEAAAWKQQEWWNNRLDKQELVNITAFRVYLEHYVSNIPTLRRNLFYMIRELDPTTEGLPIELYFFTSKTEWRSYEIIQADVIDQVIAMAPKFGLRIYQRPTGYDIRHINAQSSTVSES